MPTKKKKKTKKGEKPKRLKPTTPTIKELFAVSLNRCAFPGCSQQIIDANGALLGEICHIEAVMDDEPRFNKKMTNEQRRHKSNLILMCSVHHTITNNVEIYPTPKMMDMKKQHESKALKALVGLGDHFEEVEDLSAIKRGQPPKTLKAFAKFMKYGDPADIEADKLVYIELHKDITSLPDHIRKLFALVLEKMMADSRSNKDRYLANDRIVRNDTGKISFETFKERMYYLRDKGFVSLDSDPVDGDTWILCEYKNESYFHTLLQYCTKNKINIYELILNGNFTLLDK